MNLTDNIFDCNLFEKINDNTWLLNTRRYDFEVKKVPNGYYLETIDKPNSNKIVDALNVYNTDDMVKILCKRNLNLLAEMFG